MRVLSHYYQFITQTIATLMLLTLTVHLTRCSTSITYQAVQGQCPTLYLLNVEPYPVDFESGGIWDRGFELIPAGHLAAEQINHRSDLLPGHQLELINIDSEACGINVISKGIINVYRELVSPSRACIVGVIGLFCSRVTSAISPIISHPNIGRYVHIAASTSPVHRQAANDLGSKDSNLFHIIESSSVFNEAALALMDTYNWQRITAVHTESEFYFRTTADAFVNRVLFDPQYELITRIHISVDSSRNIKEKFDIINNKGARISYWSVIYAEAAHLLCEAFQRNFLWPGYVYIIQEHNIDRILQIETSCSREEVLIAMEGVFILDYRLYVENNTEIVSGLKYSDFQRLYDEKLNEFANVTNEILRKNVYANSLYDQVWTFALALNSSLPSVESQNLSFHDYRIGKRAPYLSNILKNELKQVSFQGASGRIDFSENQASLTHVNIFQVQKGRAKLIGVYDPYSRNVTLTEVAPHISDIPRDKFETFYELLPSWLGGFIVVVQILLFALITMNLILIIHWKREREVKATSPLLSLLMIIGCYSLCVAPLFLTMYRMFIIDNTAIVTSLCYMKVWASIGIELILATLFLRLLRIYHIFHAKQMTMMGNYWVDKYLLIYVLLICFGKVILLILWNSVSPISSDNLLEYVPGIGGTRLPYYMATTRCITSPVWSVIILLYSGVLLFMVVVLAIETRHVKNDLYKDTKKVNVFIFLVVIILAVTVPLWVIFVEINIEVWANVFEWLAYFSVPLLCQVCLFTPKTLPLAIKFASKKEVNVQSIASMITKPASFLLKINSQEKL